MRARLAKVCAHLGGLLSGCPSPAAARPSVVDWLAEHVNIVIAVLVIVIILLCMAIAELATHRPLLLFGGY